MRAIPNSLIPDVKEILLDVFPDARGNFFETYNQRTFQVIGIFDEFLQDNQSTSHRNVVRGLHYQNDPHAQAKLVRVISGRVLDVVVDLRRESPTYGRHVKYILDGNTSNMLYIPTGFAHGFLSLEDDTVFVYKCTRLYNKEAESGIIWNDPTLGIDWGIDNPIVSDRDQKLPRLKAKQKVMK